MEQTFASKPPLYTTLRHGMGCSEMELKKSFALRPDGLWSASTFAVWLEETSKTYVIYSLKSALFRGPRNTQLSGGERASERVVIIWLREGPGFRFSHPRYFASKRSYLPPAAGRSTTGQGSTISCEGVIWISNTNKADEIGFSASVRKIWRMLLRWPVALQCTECAVA